MRNVNRNDKAHQRQRRLDHLEAEQSLVELRGLLARPGRTGISVGQMVSIAASMGLLHHSRSKYAIRYEKTG